MHLVEVNRYYILKKEKKCTWSKWTDITSEKSIKKKMHVGHFFI